MENALIKLNNLKDELESDGWRHTFGRKLEVLGYFIDHDLKDIIKEIDGGIDQTREMEDRIAELEETIEQLERDAE